MTRTRVSVYGAAEGAARKWGMAKIEDTAPRCIVRVDWPKCVEGTDGGVRLDLEAVAFAEYLVGANSDRPAKTHQGQATYSKGRAGKPVAMFGSHEKPDDPKAFGLRWLAADPALGGQDRHKWTIEDAWLVNTMRRPMYAKNYRRSPLEQHQFRIRLCPDPAVGLPLAKAERMEEFGRRFMAGVEEDFSAESGSKQHFVWIGAAHYDVEHPHVHIGVRGITVEGEHVFFSQKYLRPTQRELERNPCASAPIDRRARAVLAEMIAPQEGVRHAG